MTPVVELDRVGLRYGGRRGGTDAVADLDLQVERGRFTTLLGPSGCGKTTTLRMIAGFLTPTSGRILLEGEDATRTPPEQRNIGMVFQSYALFPHLTLLDNVGYGLRMRRRAATEVRERAGAALELVGLSHLADRKPGALSGGQQQRVALARAVAIRPSVLLLDEPLSNLDAQLRVQMRRELLDVQRETGLTAILVTHDQQEALELSDTMVILNAGRLEQQGAPRAVFPAPATRFVADFLGYDAVPALPGRGPAAVRPEHVRLLPAGEREPEADTGLDGTVRTVTYQGAGCLVEVGVDGAAEPDAAVRALHPGDDLRPGDRVRAVLPARHLVELAEGSAAAPAARAGGGAR